MKLTFLFRIILLSSCLHMCHSVFGKTKKFQILKYEACADYPDLPMHVTDFKNHVYSKNNRTVELTLKVEREIKDMSTVINLWKCDTSGAPDTCEFYVKEMKVKKLCEKVPQKNQAWSDFVESFQPEFTCPVKKGTYISTTYVDEKPFRFYPLPVGLWKTKAFIYESDNIKVACVDFHIKIFEVREN